jgi:hypothetical protein
MRQVHPGFFADFLRESKECKGFMQERGSLLDTFPQQGILGVAGHEQDHQSGPQFPGAFGEFASAEVRHNHIGQQEIEEALVGFA